MVCCCSIKSFWHTGGWLWALGNKEALVLKILSSGHISPAHPDRILNANICNHDLKFEPLCGCEWCFRIAFLSYNQFGCVVACTVCQAFVRFSISISSLLIYKVSRPTFWDSTIPITSSSFKYRDAAFLSTPNLFTTKSIFEYGCSNNNYDRQQV